MKTIEQLNKLTDEKFKRIFGVNRRTFLLMLEKLNEQYTDSHKKGGRPPKINTLNRLCIFLAYYRNYRTMEDIASEYGIVVSTTFDIIHLVENTLSSCEEFQLPDRAKLKEKGECPYFCVNGILFPVFARVSVFNHTKVFTVPF